MDPALLAGPYKIPRLGFSMSMVWTNTMGKGAYRGPWMFETTAREMAIDHAAREIGLDPDRAPPQEPARGAPTSRSPSPGGKVFTEITPLETLDQALEMLDYEAFRAEQAAARAEGRCSGSGSACTSSPPRWARRPSHTEGATVRVEASGKVVAFLGTTSHGQSVETTMAQIVADTLGVGYDDVTVVQADTQSTPYGPGTGGSRTAVVAGGAAAPATRGGARQGARGRGARDRGAPSDLEIEDGRCSCGARRRRSITMQRGRARPRTASPTQLPPELGARARGNRPVPARARSPPGRTPRTSASSRSTATRACRGAALHRVRGLRPDDQPDRRRGSDLRRRRPGPRRRAPRGLRLRRRRQPAHHAPSSTTCCRPPREVPTSRSATSTLRVHHQPGRVQGHGRGRRDRHPRGGRQRGGDALAHLGVRRARRRRSAPNDIFALVEAARAAEPTE